MESSVYLDNTNVFKQGLGYAESTTPIPTTLSDDFATLNEGRWASSKSGDAPYPAIDAGRLKIAPPNTGYSGYASLTSNRSATLKGQSVSLDIVQYVTDNYTESYLQFLGTAGGYGYIYRNGEGYLLCRIFNKNGGQAVSQYYDANSDTSWRVRGEDNGGNGKLYLESGDGTTWTTRLVCEAQDWDIGDCTFVVVAGRYYGGYSAAPFIVDNFVYSGDGVVSQPSVPPITKKLFTKQSNSDGWDTGLFSKKLYSYPTPDQRIRFYIKGSSKYRRVGFVTADYIGFDYPLSLGVQLNDDNTMSVIVDGNSNVANIGAYNDGMEVSLQIYDDNNNGQLVWKIKTRSAPGQAESVRYTSPKTDAQLRALFPLFVKAAFYSGGSQIDKILVEVANNIQSIDTIQGGGRYKIPYLDKGTPLTTRQGVIEHAVGQGGGPDIWFAPFANDVSALGRVFVSPAPKSGNTSKVQIVTMADLAVGQEVKFDVRVNGVSIFASANDYLAANHDNPNPFVNTIQALVEADKVEVFCMSNTGVVLVRPIFLKVVY